MNTLNTIEKIKLTLLGIFLLVFPILFLSGLSASIFILPKLILLISFVLLLAIIQVLAFLHTGEISFKSSKYDLPLTLIVVAYVVSSILQTPNKYDAFFLPGTTTVVIGGFLLFVLINQFEEKYKSLISALLVFSGLTLSIILLLHQAGALESIPGLNIQLLPGFSPTGSLVSSIVFLAALTPLSTFHSIAAKNPAVKALFAVITLILILAAGATSISLLPKRTDANQSQDATLKIAPLDVSWEVALDTFKASPLFGSGPGNYITSFTRYKPLSYNTTDNWSLRFSSARNFYLTLFTETGLIGLIAASLFIIKFAKYALRTFKKGPQSSEYKKAMVTSSSIVLILLLLFPANITILITLFCLLALASTTTENKFGTITVIKQEGSRTSTGGVRTIPTLLLIVLLVTTFVVGRAELNFVKAENNYLKAFRAFNNNQGIEAYNYARTAVETAPKVDRYHSLFAEINLAVADALSRNTQGEEQEEQNISEETRAQIAQLVQQAVEEGKATVNLNRFRSDNWAVLARIYRNTIPFAQGADQFTIATYNQAIALNPTDPTLRIELGGVYYSLGRYEDAAKVFELAVLAKPDYANARYNYAIALKEQGKIEQAIQQMKNVISLVNPESKDFEAAQRELEALEELRTEATAPETPTTEEETTPETLVQPEVQEPVIEPQIELPESSFPPEGVEDTSQENNQQPEE